MFIAGDWDSSYRSVYVKNPQRSTSALSVAVWSDAGGQDDLFWKNLDYYGDGLWAVTFDCYELTGSGMCIAHVYDDAGFVKGASFSVSSSEVANISGNGTLDRYLREIYANHGTDLYSLFNYVANYPYYSGSKYPTGEWSIPFAIEMYQNGGGNCYRYAALFCWLARGLGYDANVVAGSVPSYSGYNNPHGWVEIHQNGVTYVCDPDLKHENPGYNWYMVTYDNAPTWYYK